MVNNFYPTMSQKVFNPLRDHHQIPKHIPFHLPRKFERCYSGKTTVVGMYDAMFTARLRLPVMELHCQLANYLSLSISKLAPNAWRIFIGAKVIWGQLNGGNRRLTLNEFFYSYKPQQISSSKGIDHFQARKLSLRLVFDMPNSNRNWNNMYFLLRGWTGCVDLRSRIACLTGLTILTILSRILLSHRYLFLIASSTFSNVSNFLLLTFQLKSIRR